LRKEVSGARLSADEREELKRLRKEVRNLRMEKEILKKASQYFAKEMK
jgi:transposase